MEDAKTTHAQEWVKTKQVREEYKKGHRIALALSSSKNLSKKSLYFTKEERELAESYNDGTLLEKKKEANKQWGHGDGADVASLEQIAVMQYQLRAYFDT